MSRSLPPAASTGEAVRSEDFPALRELGLGVDDLAALRRQGYLQSDERGSGNGGYWRLRFRMGGRLRTLYVGKDRQQVEAVREELARLQAGRRNKQALSCALERGRDLLRDVKRRLAPQLEEVGIYYHGDALRRRRHRASTASPANP